MSYIEKNLGNNETIIVLATLHWSTYIKSILLFVLSSTLIHSAPFFAAIFFVFSIVTILRIKKTEIAITNSRLIKKTGIIGANVTSMNLNKIESVLFRQGIFEKIFDTGSVIALGTGQGKFNLKNIDSALKFKKTLEETIVDEKKAGH